MTDPPIRRHGHRRGVRGKLADRDYEILRHLRRYRLTTRVVLGRLFFEGSELNAVSKVVSRLEQKGFLLTHELAAGTGRNYYTVGPAGCSLFGIPPKRSGALGPQALLTDLAILLYCCGRATESTRKRLLVSELATKQPGLLGKGMDAGRYVLETPPVGVSTLGFVRVDHGGDVAHIVRKCVEDMEKRAKVPAIRELMDHRRFVLVIVTASEDKKLAFQDALARRPWLVQFRVEAAPGLTPLVSPLPT